MRRSHPKIYQSWWHVLATLMIVALPFVFLLVFSRLAKIATDVLFYDVLVSSWRLFVAYVIAAMLAWMFAVLFYRGKLAKIMLPLFDVLQSFPTFAVLPIAVSLGGRSEWTVIGILILTVIWPIFFSLLSSLKLIRREWEEASTIYQPDRRTYLRRFLLPITMPCLITGSVVGLGEGWEALVATEIIVRAPNGLGSFFQTFSTSVPITAFGVLGLLLLIFSINKLLWLPLLEWSHRLMEE